MVLLGSFFFNARQNGPCRSRQWLKCETDIKESTGYDLPDLKLQFLGCEKNMRHQKAGVFFVSAVGDTWRRRIIPPSCFGTSRTSTPGRCSLTSASTGWVGFSRDLEISQAAEPPIFKTWVTALTVWYLENLAYSYFFPEKVKEVKVEGVVQPAEVAFSRFPGADRLPVRTPGPLRPAV